MQRHRSDHQKAVEHRDALISSGGCLLVEWPRNAASSGQYSFIHCASDALYNSALVLGLKGNGNWKQDHSRQGEEGRTKGQRYQGEERWCQDGRSPMVEPRNGCCGACYGNHQPLLLCFHWRLHVAAEFLPVAPGCLHGKLQDSH